MGTIKLDSKVYGDYPQHARDKWDALTDEDQASIILEGGIGNCGEWFAHDGGYPNDWVVGVLDGVSSVIAATTDHDGGPELKIIPMDELIESRWEDVADWLDCCDE